MVTPAPVVLASVVERGLWRRPDGSKAYAATNPSEYFAELTMWYLGSHGEFADAVRKLPAPGPASLAWYDPGGFQLVGGIYEGTHRSLREPSAGGADDGATARGPPIRLGPVEEGACSEEKPGAPVEIRIQAGDDTVLSSIAWINADGEAVPYASGGLPPGGTFTQRTYPGHVWEAAAARRSEGAAQAGMPQRLRYRVRDDAALQLVDVHDDLEQAQRGDCLDELV